MADLPDSLFLSDRLLAHYVQYNDSLYHKAAAELRRLAAVEAERDALLALIADDAFASSFQTMAQYRSALLKAMKGGGND